jgi:hypothetical protein
MERNSPPPKIQGVVISFHIYGTKNTHPHFRPSEISFHIYGTEIPHPLKNGVGNFVPYIWNENASPSFFTACLTRTIAFYLRILLTEGIKNSKTSLKLIR